MKAQKKQTNLSETLEPQPTYYGKIIAFRDPDVRDDTVAQETEIL